MTTRYPARATGPRLPSRSAAGHRPRQKGQRAPPRPAPQLFFQPVASGDHGIILQTEPDGRTETQRAPVDHALDPHPGHGLESADSAEDRIAMRRHDGARQRVFGIVFEGRRQMQRLG
jgi:hypothetical protein